MVRRILSFMLVFSLVGSLASFAAGAEEPSEIATASAEPQVYHLETYFQEPDTNATKDWPEGPLVEAMAAIVMDLDTDAILYAKNVDQQLYPASITKLLTGLIACEHLNPEDHFTMSESAAYGIEAGSSSIYGDTGEEFTVEQALMGLCLESANEMAMVLGELVSGSVKKFVELMNQRARELTCTESHFNNPHGLPDDMHYTSARDMAKIGKAAWQNLTFRRYFTTDYYEIPPTNVMEETRYLLNHHRMMAGRDYAYSGVVGGKTGYTDDAGNTLVTFASRGGVNLVAVVLGGTAGGFADTTLLLDYGFDNFEHLTLYLDDPLPELLPAEYFALSDTALAFPYRRNVVVTVPRGTKRDEIVRRQALLENAVGPYRIKSKYYFHDRMVGFALQYEQPLYGETQAEG